MAAAANSIMYWKLAIWKAWAGSVLVICGVCPSLVLNWDTMTISGRVVAVIGVCVALVKFLDAFFDQTVSRLSQGMTPVQVAGMNGQSVVHSETTIVTDATKLTTPAPAGVEGKT